MRWVITGESERSRASPERMTVGHGSLSLGLDSKMRLRNGARLPYLFRLRDADENIYYIGRSDDHGFEPLAWAQSFDTCTDIQFKIGRRWQTL